VDDELIKILAAAPSSNETVDEANTRKERILGSMLGRLGVVEARGMWLRLSRVREGDPLSETFGKFPGAMRTRVLEFLVDERRLKSLAATPRR
jgi:hypothetical protein